MFKEFRDPWPPVDPPPPPRPRISKRDEAVILWLVAIAALLLLIGPFAGASLLDLLG